MPSVKRFLAERQPDAKLLRCITWRSHAATPRRPASHVPPFPRRRKHLVSKANAKKTALTATERERVNFGKIPECMELPNLISV